MTSFFDTSYRIIYIICIYNTRYKLNQSYGQYATVEIRYLVEFVFTKLEKKTMMTNEPQL